jgi:dihydrodipicolinate synthase/N-acetylneuraminate lyase
LDQILQGIVCATVTPFKADGSLDERSIGSLCRYLIEAKVNALYPLGTNGEGVLLKTDVRKRAAEVFAAETGKQIPVVIQCGAATTEEAVELAHHTAAIHASGIGVMTPFFFNQDESALLDYYAAVANAAPELPLYLYNIPSHTNNDIFPSLVAKIAKLAPNFVGVKYSASDLSRLSEYIQAIPGKGVLIGCDRLILPALSLGAVGTVSGPAMAFPHLFTGLWKAYQAGDLATARKYQARLLELDKALAGFPGIPLLKEILKRRGAIECPLSIAPLRQLNEEECGRLERIIRDFDNNGFWK